MNKICPVVDEIKPIEESTASLWQQTRFLGIFYCSNENVPG
jgi:hypothetical protein